MPDQCHHKWIKNGFYRSRARGFVQRWVCTTCGQTRKDFERHFSTGMLQAFALLALELPLDQAEYLTGLKSEKIRTKLMSAYGIAERWTAIVKGLSELGISDLENTGLESMVHIASLTNRFSLFGPWRKEKIATLRTRIAAILGTEVVVGRSRQGVRVCKTEAMIHLIRTIRAWPPERLNSAGLLSEKDMVFVRRLHALTGNIQIWAALNSSEREFDPQAKKLLPPKVTLPSLADGLHMNLDEFIDILVRLVRKLPKPSWIPGKSKQASQRTDQDLKKLLPGHGG